MARLRFAERVYRLLLRSYPGEFRDEYEREMLQAFRDCLGDDRRIGARALITLWRHVLVDSSCGRRVNISTSWAGHSVCLAVPSTSTRVRVHRHRDAGAGCWRQHSHFQHRPLWRCVHCPTSRRIA